MERNTKFLCKAAAESRKSPDRSTKNGAVLVLSSGDWCSGCNTYVDVKKVTIAEHLRRQADRETKLAWTEHAERNAIFQAVRSLQDVRGSTLFCPFAACVDCARAMVGCGVAELVRLPAEAFGGFPERWRASIAMADDILRAGGVVITEHREKLGETYWLDGKEWQI